MIGAVVYVRVSDPRQVENLSLGTQVKACEEYCARQGFAVLERFTEQGESAKTADRTELQKLLTYCRTHKGRVQFLVVYNLTRFSRDTHDHHVLRNLLRSFGVSLRSATEPIDDTSSGVLMEGMLAVIAKFDNDVRSERARAGMKAALERGHWTFPAPLGYLPGSKHGQSLIPDPVRSTLIVKAFEDFASGARTKQDVLAEVTALGLRTKYGAALSPQTLGKLLRNPIYMGRVESPDFGVSRTGNFAALVSEATFYRVQGILDGRIVVAGPRVRNHPDFPLRGFVRCDTCSRPLTGSWSKGRHGGYYAYYHCQRQCRAVNVSKAALEGAFVDVLTALQPSAGFMRLVKAHVLEEWEQQRALALRYPKDQEEDLKTRVVSLRREKSGATTASTT